MIFHQHWFSYELELYNLVSFSNLKYMEESSNFTCLLLSIFLKGNDALVVVESLVQVVVFCAYVEQEVMDQLELARFEPLFLCYSLQFIPLMQIWQFKIDFGQVFELLFHKQLASLRLKFHQFFILHFWSTFDFDLWKVSLIILNQSNDF